MFIIGDKGDQGLAGINGQSGRDGPKVSVKSRFYCKINSFFIMLIIGRQGR